MGAKVVLFRAGNVAVGLNKRVDNETSGHVPIGIGQSALRVTARFDIIIFW